MSIFKQKKFISKSGKEYTFQFPGIRAVSKIRDRVKNKFGIPQDEKTADEVLAHVVVSPNMKIEDFGSDITEFNEVIFAAINFMNGEDDDDEQDKVDGNN